MLLDCIYRTQRIEIFQYNPVKLALQADKLMNSDLTIMLQSELLPVSFPGLPLNITDGFISKYFLDPLD